jgi:hypothetical protein
MVAWNLVSRRTETPDRYRLRRPSTILSLHRRPSAPDGGSGLPATGCLAQDAAGAWMVTAPA